MFMQMRGPSRGGGSPPGPFKTELFRSFAAAFALLAFISIPMICLNLMNFTAIITFYIGMIVSTIFIKMIKEGW